MFKSSSFSISKVFSLFLMILLITPMYGQSLRNRIRNKVRQKAHREAEKEAERKIDEAIDEEIESSRNQRDSVKTASTNDNVEVTYEEVDDSTPIKPNEFIGSMSLEMMMSKNGKPEKNMPMFLNYHFDEYRFAMEMPVDPKKGDEMITIMDRKNRKTTTKMVNSKGEKTAMIMKSFRTKVTVTDENLDSYKLTPTGKSKTILGYDCKEYTIDSDEYEGTAWLAKGIPSYWEGMSDFVQVKGKKGDIQSNMAEMYGAEGFPLESHTTKKGTTEVMDYYVRKLDMGSVNEEVFSLDGYQVQDMSNMFGN